MHACVCEPEARCYRNIQIIIMDAGLVAGPPTRMFPSTAGPSQPLPQPVLPPPAQPPLAIPEITRDPRILQPQPQPQSQPPLAARPPLQVSGRGCILRKVFCPLGPFTGFVRSGQGKLEKSGEIRKYFPVTGKSGNIYCFQPIITS